MARKGRRPGSPQTRDEILAAARRIFSEKGYDATTIRAIAGGAQVDPALVHHYFGAKDQVFIAAMELPYDPGDVVRRIFADAEHDTAEQVVRFFLDVWDDPEIRAPMVALIRSAASNDRAAEITRGFMSDVIRSHIAANAGISPVLAGVVASQLFGLVLMRYVVRIEPVASANPDELVALYAPAIRAVLAAAESPRVNGR